MENTNCEVKVRLIVDTKSYTWRIDVCPFCENSHHHGGGHISENPLHLLGARTPHCHDSPRQCSNYFLTLDTSSVIEFYARPFSYRGRGKDRKRLQPALEQIALHEKKLLEICEMSKNTRYEALADAWSKAFFNVAYSKALPENKPQRKRVAA